jgi:hypothetical protein
LPEAEVHAAQRPGDGRPAKRREREREKGERDTERQGRLDTDNPGEKGKKKKGGEKKGGEEVREWLVLRKWGTAQWIMFVSPAA